MTLNSPLSTLNSSLSAYASAATTTHSPPDQLSNFARAALTLQPRQLAASAAARLCDLPDGPTAIGFGGARGGGKSFWLLSQIAADDCQRFPGLKCLLLRKVGKSMLEQFEDLRQSVLRYLPHDFSGARGQLIFPNGSRIRCGHFQSEKDLDAYLGLEFDVIGIEEATTLTFRKYSDILSCCRSSKSFPSGAPWRPRIYSTTNPGNVGHHWYKKVFITPFRDHAEIDTRFIPALVSDNSFLNSGYCRTLERETGWRKRAWLFGDWDIAAGQFFTTFRRDIHVLNDFDDGRGVEWFAALDYGFTHPTVVLLACTDSDGNIFVVDEHVERLWLPQRHAPAIKAMFDRHNVCLTPPQRPPGFEHRGAGRTMGLVYPDRLLYRRWRVLSRFVAGHDAFGKQSDGSTVASQYKKEGIHLRPATTERIAGWAEILHRLGDPDAGVAPRLFIHQRCARLLNCLPALQHDPNRPEDVLKTDIDDEGSGGDDPADCLRYLVATKRHTITPQKLHGL